MTYIHHIHYVLRMFLEVLPNIRTTLETTSILETRTYAAPTLGVRIHPSTFRIHSENVLLLH